MHLITTVMYAILLFGEGVELTSFKDHFRAFVQSVAGKFHSDWREVFLPQHPYVRNRFKPTKYGNKYNNSSDFLYPMIITVNGKFISCIVHRNLKVARDRLNSSQIYVDILNMENRELPDDRANENRATARIACRHVLRGLRGKRSFNQNFIDEVAEIIHIEWEKRHQHEGRTALMKPYMELSEPEKDKDRKGVLAACRVYNEQFLFDKFNTTPVHFIGRIKLLVPFPFV